MQGASKSTVGDTEFIAHTTPVWRDQADFFIQANIRDEHDTVKRFEQLWCKQIGPARFVVCCIPFFLYDVALGDEVETAPRDGMEFVFDRVHRDAGHFTFRVWFTEAVEHDWRFREQIVATARDIGCLHEWYSHTLLSIDAPNEDAAREWAGYLTGRQELGELLYETGRSSHE